MVDNEDVLQDNVQYRSVTQRLIEPNTEYLFNWRVRIAVVFIFMFLVSFSAVLIPQLEIGLDQKMILPKDSYVYKYLIAVSQLMHIGPPVFFVLINGLNFTNDNHQNVIRGGQLCNYDSLTTQIFLSSRFSDITYIVRTSTSWLDDFFDWASLLGSCCQYNTTTGGFCSSADISVECLQCFIDTEFKGLL